MQIAKCKLEIGDCRLEIADCKTKNAFAPEGQLKIAQRFIAGLRAPRAQ